MDGTESESKDEVSLEAIDRALLEVLDPTRIINANWLLK